MKRLVLVFAAVLAVSTLFRSTVTTVKASDDEVRKCKPGLVLAPEPEDIHHMGKYTWTEFESEDCVKPTPKAAAPSVIDYGNTFSLEVFDNRYIGQPVLDIKLDGGSVCGTSGPNVQNPNKRAFTTGNVVPLSVGTKLWIGSIEWVVQYNTITGKFYGVALN